MKKHKIIALGLFALGSVLITNGAYIHVKASLAQLLIKSAWARTLDGERQAQPWWWADTWPVAHVTVANNSIEWYVLSGANGAALAFGPGHYESTSLPGERGVSVIAGHRNTHFRSLEMLAVGDVLRVENRKGDLSVYRITEKRIIDSTVANLEVNDAYDQLKLVTCYPFDAIRPGGPLRMVVSADYVGRVTSR